MRIVKLPLFHMERCFFSCFEQGVRCETGRRKEDKMVSWIISRVVVLLFGMLYPAYYSYKAVRTKSVKEYVRWMMYWIVFALYTVAEAIADLSVAWFPLYYELKMCVVIWLVSPYTRGAGLIFRNERLRSFSIPDITQDLSSQSAFMKSAKLPIQSADSNTQGSDSELAGHGEEVDGMFSEDDSSPAKGLRRTQSVKMSRAKVIRKETSCVSDSIRGEKKTRLICAEVRGQSVAGSPEQEQKEAVLKEKDDLFRPVIRSAFRPGVSQDLRDIVQQCDVS
ncbi:Receptor expression-enhancing protein 3-A [Bagarius yarrelli]|uniref:Receptor expression-enhancing protein n=1 Tax=Bagarius yarrelli TaxID=175774 RepID=A0A556V3B1_BAGYA|nr:Receptor expression-enhancing protein 3-A [Bagarius yarrelli]